MVCLGSFALNPSSMKSHFSGKGHRGVKMYNYYKTHVHGKTEQEYREAYDDAAAVAAAFVVASSPQQPKRRKRVASSGRTVDPSPPQMPKLSSAQVLDHWFETSLTVICQYDECGLQFQSQVLLTYFICPNLIQH